MSKRIADTSFCEPLHLDEFLPMAEIKCDGSDPTLVKVNCVPFQRLHD